MRAISTAAATLGSTHYRTEISTKDFTLHCDEPVALGGANSAPAPYDYLVAGLAACTLITLRMYGEHKGWELGELSVNMTLSQDQEKNTYIHRKLRASAELSDEQWERMLNIASKTPVTLTLMHGSKITTERAD